MKLLYFSLLLSISILFMSCEKEKEDEINKELEMFLSRTAIQFKGNVIEEEVNWIFSNWQNGIGTYTQSFWCLTADKKIQQRNFSIYDYDQREKIISIKIKSPAFSIDSSFAYKKSIFDPGIKKIRNPEDEIFKGFDIEVSSSNGFFSTIYGNQNLSSLEILKIMDVQPLEGLPDYNEFKAWFLISCKLYKPNGEYAGKIEKGMMIGNFEIDRNGNIEDLKHTNYKEENDCGCKLQ